MVGIGGAGMSALARLYLAQGHAVSGSDESNSAALRDLRDLGAAVQVGHDAAHVAGAGLVVTSSAVPATRPELVAARAAGITVLKHAQALGALFNEQRGIAVAGTHGKTTTTSMIAFVLDACGPARPSSRSAASWSIWAPAPRWGSGEWMVIEADEFDRRFLEYRPEIAVVTNVEPDHFEYYASVDGDGGGLRRLPRSASARGARSSPAPRSPASPGCSLPDSERRVLRYGIAAAGEQPGRRPRGTGGRTASCSPRAAARSSRAPGRGPGRRGAARRSRCRAATTCSTPWRPSPSAPSSASRRTRARPRWAASTAPGAASSWPARPAACASTRTTPTTRRRCGSTWKRPACCCRPGGACGPSSSPTSTSARRGCSTSSPPPSTPPTSSC